MAEDLQKDPVINPEWLSNVGLRRSKLEAVNFGSDFIESTVPEFTVGTALSEEQAVLRAEDSTLPEEQIQCQRMDEAYIDNFGIVRFAEFEASRDRLEIPEDMRNPGYQYKPRNGKEAQDLSEARERLSN